MSVASPIVVGVRVRPFNQREVRFQSQCIVEMDPQGGVRLLQVSGGKVASNQPPREFIFDHAFWTHERNAADNTGAGANAAVEFADQAVVYNKIAVPVLRNVLDGFNACLFAYGQTGSGKTYSMMGTPSDRGVLPRLGDDLFADIANLKERMQTACAVEASFCEIYNEKVRDLMSTSDTVASAADQAPPSLAIRLDPKKGIFVEGLLKFNVTNAEDFYMFLEKGLNSRAVGTTNMNATSSRSHAVVIIVVTQSGPAGDKSGRLCLVDLAGSERVAATGATGQTALEGQNINLSLTTLGICLKRLAEQAEAQGKKAAAALPIPYRDSSLTFLLKENLGGNSRTAMLANISPASVNYDETLATLRFASVARKVKSVATVNENPQTKLILQLREELAALKEQYQKRLERKGSTPGPTPPLLVIAAAPVALQHSPPELAAGSSSLKECIRDDSQDNKEQRTDDVELQRDGSPDSSPSETYDDDDDDGALLTMDEVRKERGTSIFTVPKLSIPLSAGGAPSFALNFSKLKSQERQDDIENIEEEKQSSDCKAPSVTLLHLGTGGTASNDQWEEGTPLTSSYQGNAGSLAQHAIDIDPSKPHLVHLNPDTAHDSGIPLVMTLEEGDNEFDVGGAEVIIFWDALGGQTIIFGSPETIAVNGEAIADEGCVLRHKDRVVILGVIAFRFSYAAGVVAQEGGFNKIPVDVYHVELLEKYYRATIRLERSRDAMSIAKAFVIGAFAPVLSLTAGPSSPKKSSSETLDSPSMRPLTARVGVTRMKPSGALTARGQPRSADAAAETPDDFVTSFTPRATPRSSHPTLAALGDDIAMCNELIYKLEVELADTYPAPLPPLFDAEEEVDKLTWYKEAMDEVRRGREEQERELEWLRQQLHNRGANHSHHGPPSRESSAYFGFGEEDGDGELSKARSFSRIFTSPSVTLRTMRQDTDLVDKDSSRQRESGPSIPLQEASSPSPAPKIAPQHTEAVKASAPDADTPARRVTFEESPFHRSLLSLGPAEIADEQRMYDSLTTRMVQLELAYHRKLRSLQTFSRDGPKNAVDKDLWSRLYTNPPFLGDPALQCDQSCYCQVKDTSLLGGGSSWQPRFISSSSKFLYIFKKADGRERCMAALYLPGAAMHVVNDKDLELLPACPRHEKDVRATTSKDAAAVFRFRDSEEVTLWAMWIRQHSVPNNAPSHVVKRAIAERLAANNNDDITTNTDLAAPSAYAFDSSAATTAAYRSSAPAGGLNRVPAAIPLTDVCNTANWKPDRAVTNCESCNTAFSFFTRRHHCRRCGGIFCSACVSKDKNLPQKELACETCRVEIANAVELGASNNSRADSNSPSGDRKSLKKQYKKNTTVSSALGLTNYVQIRSDAIPQLERLVEDFIVKMDVVDSNAAASAVVSQEFVRMRVDHYQNRFHCWLSDEIVSVARCPLDSTKLYLRVSTASMGLHGGAGTQLLPNHSAHHSTNGGALCKSLYFQDAFHRELCFESLVMLLGIPFYLNTLLSVRDIRSFPNTDILVKEHRALDQDPGGGNATEGDADDEVALLRTIAGVSTEITVWFGLEADRIIPFHNTKCQLFAVVGYQQSWNEKMLESFGLAVVCTVKMGKKRPNLYLVCDTKLRARMQGPPSICPVFLASSQDSAQDYREPQTESVVACAIGLQLMETSILFVASNDFEVEMSRRGAVPGDNELPQIPSQISLDGLKMMSFPPVDVMQWYDHVFTVGCTAPLPEFKSVSSTADSAGATGVSSNYSNSSLIQYRSSLTRVARSGKSFTEFSLPCIHYVISKLSIAPDERMMIRVTRVAFSKSPQFDAHAQQEDVTGTIVVWGNFGFDRVDDKMKSVEHQETVRVNPQPIGDHLRCGLRAILLASSLTEYQATRSLYVSIVDPQSDGSIMGSAVVIKGTAIIPLAEILQSDSVTTSASVLRAGLVVGSAEISIECKWV